VYRQAIYRAGMVRAAIDAERWLANTAGDGCPGQPSVSDSGFEFGVEA